MRQQNGKSWDSVGKEWVSLPSRGIKKDWGVKARLPKPRKKLGTKRGKQLGRQKPRQLPVKDGVLAGRVTRKD